MALVGVALPTTAALASQPRVSVATPLPIPQGDVKVGTDITTSFDVALTQSNKAALDAYVADLYNTSSPLYHHFLTPTTFAQKFGASPSTISQVRDYFQSYGLRVGALSRGHIILHVSGLTSKIARAFNTSIATVRVAGGSLQAQLTQTATLPAAIASDVTGVSGLSSVLPPSTTSLVAHTATATTCPSAGSSTGTTPNSLGGYTLQQQAQLYGFSTAWAKGNTGVGQTIAVYELGLYKATDVQTYMSCYGINPTITAVNVDGGPGTAYSDEATMDVEEAAALAPGAQFQVYQGPNANSGPTDTYQQIADDNTASIVTTSWGTCEADPNGSASTELPIFEQMAAQGQTIISAAGDYGSSDCVGITTKTAAVDDPSSSPFVTGVGGLTISSTSPLTQTVWNDGLNSGGGAGGGGASSLWSRPSWQNGVGISASQTMRMVPDLSVMADPTTGFIQYYTGSGTGFCRHSCSGGWGSIGGTSIGAPLVSALVAVAAQSCGVSRLGMINPQLYANQSTAFTDVTTGSNDLYGVGSYNAGVGYDMASGLGSPNANFISALCPPTFSLAKSTINADASALTSGDGANVQATLNDVNAKPIINALITVNAQAASGTITINNDDASATGAGVASYVVTSDLTGGVNFNVSSTSPGPVKVTMLYQGQPIYSTTISFAMAPPTTTTTVASLGSATISKLTALSGAIGFVVAATGVSSSSVVSYQYTLNHGASWVSVSKASGGKITITGLKKGATYYVAARVITSRGPTSSSPTSKVVTKK